MAPGALKALLDLPILCLVDLKHVDADRFREGTGGNLASIGGRPPARAGLKS